MGAARDDSRCGEWLNGSYRLDQLLRDTGQTQVYRASSRSGERVLLRLLRPEYALQRQVVSDFTGLAKTLSQVPEHLSPVIAVGTDDTGIPFVVEAVGDDWITLADRLADGLTDRGERTPEGVLAVLEPIVEAVAALHRAGAIHGCLEPNRIALPAALDEAGGARVALLAQPPVDAAAISATSGGDGGGEYLAPESVGVDRAALAPTVDVYALGALLARALTGVPPSAPELRERLVGPWPPALATLVFECLAEEPDARPADAGALLSRLRAAIGGGSSTPVSATAARASSTPATVPDWAEVADRDGEPLAGVPADAGDLADAFAPLGADAGSEVSQSHRERAPSGPSRRGRGRGEGRGRSPSSGPPGDGAGRESTRSARPARRRVQRRAFLEDGAATAPSAPAKRARVGKSGAQTRRQQATALSEAQLARLVATGRDRQRGLGRLLWLLLLLLFIFSLTYAAPLLVEPKLHAARALFGERIGVAAAVLVAGTFVALIKVWALAIESKALLLKPVVVLMQGTAVCVAITAGGAFIPGGFEMLSTLAGRALPWLLSLLFLFGGLYGLMQALQQFGAALLQSLLTMAVALAGIGASAFVLDAAAAFGGSSGPLGAAAEHPLRLTPGGGGVMGDGEAMGEPQRVIDFHERKTIGDGKSDMEDIEALRRGRRRNAAELDEVQRMADPTRVVPGAAE